MAGTASYILPATNLRKAERTISSSNSLMNSESANYREYVRWVKGGFTTLAGRCIVAFAQKDGHTYGLVILGSDLDLLPGVRDPVDWAFASFADRALVDTETALTTVDLKKCRTDPAVELYAAAPVSGYGHADDKVTYSYDLPENISATVKDGAVLGTATVYLDGYEVGTVDLVTHQEYVSDFRTDLRPRFSRCSAQKQGGVVGSASEVRVPFKVRCECWEPQPVLRFGTQRLRTADAAITEYHSKLQKTIKNSKSGAQCLATGF